MKSAGIKYIIAISLVLFALGANAATPEATAQVVANGPIDWMMQNVIIVLGFGMVILAFGALVHANTMLLQSQKVRLLQEQGIEVLEKVQIRITPEIPWWKRTYDRLTQVVPVRKEEKILLNHEYDGIRELDNVLPPWWLALFYITIAMSVAYMGYYHVFDYGLDSAEEYEASMQQAQEAILAYIESQPDMIDETNVNQLVDDMDLVTGASIFQTQCTPCHGQYAEGNSIGPNLTDEYWIHGGSIQDVFRTIKYGVPEKGMIAWSSQLRAADIQKVASYILSLQGSNPPDAKAPQGELWSPTVQAQDSTSVIGQR